MYKLILVFISIFIIFFGCRRQDNIQEKTLKGKIAVIVSNLENPFFSDIKEGIIKKSFELGYETVIFDSKDDIELELLNMKQAITHNVQALLFNPVDSGLSVNIVLLANEKGIPVITIDRSIDKGVVKSHIESDNIAGGRMAAEYLIRRLWKNAKIIELKGPEGVSSVRERSEGFEKAIIGKLDLTEKLKANFERTKGFDVTNYFLSTGGEVAGIFAQNDEMAMGAMEAMEISGRTDVILIGFDGTFEAIEAVKSGRMDATIAQKPYNIGLKSVEIADMFLRGMSIEQYVPVELEIISADF